MGGDAAVSPDFAPAHSRVGIGLDGIATRRNQEILENDAPLGPDVDTELRSADAWAVEVTAVDTRLCDVESPIGAPTGHCWDLCGRHRGGAGCLSEGCGSDGGHDEQECNTGQPRC